LSLEKKCLQESPEWGQRWCGGDTGWQCVPRSSSCDWECSVAKWRPECGRNHDVGTGDRAQSLARLNLGHEREVFREVFRADAMQTAIHHDAEFECHSFWHWQPVQLLQQWCNVVVTTDAVDHSRCHVENVLCLLCLNRHANTHRYGQSDRGS